MDSPAALDGLQIAEALWLAAYCPAPASQQTTAQEEQASHSSPASDNDQKPAGQERPEETPAREDDPKTGSENGEPAAGVSLPGESTEKPETSATAFLSPSGRAVGTLSRLARALRPLSRKVSDPFSRVLNTEATVERFAQAALCDPWAGLVLVLEPGKRRAWEIVLLVDQVEGEAPPTHLLLEELAREVKEMLRWQGAFRVVLAPWLEQKGNTVTTSGLESLASATGDRLFVVLTDMRTSAWASGSALLWLGKLARHAPVSVWHTFPERLWRRTVAGTPRWHVRNRRPGTTNSQWLVEERPGIYSKRPSDVTPDGFVDLGLPIVALEPEALERWARFVAGDSRFTLPAIRLRVSLTERPDPPLLEADPFATPEEYTVEERLRTFFDLASPEAQRLAGLCAGVPLTLPILRLVQQTFMPRSHPSILAELLMSPLVAPLGPGRFVWREGIAQELALQVPVPDTLEVRWKIGEFLGTSAETMTRFETRVLEIQEGTETRLEGKGLTDGELFAYLSSSTLAQLGLLRSSSIEVSHQEKVNQEEIIFQDTQEVQENEHILSVFTSDSKHPVADIIFIHGLGGNGTTYWGKPDNSNDYWLHWLGEDLVESNIFSFQYKSDINTFSGSLVSLNDEATNLISTLQNQGLGKRPIFFVAHSLGGLLVKQALRLGMTQNTSGWELLVRQVKGICFLATPHSSDISRVIQAIQVTQRQSFIESHKEQLRELSQWYSNNAPSLGIATAAYFETQKTLPDQTFKATNDSEENDKQGIIIVDEASANPHIPGVRPIALNHDHNSLKSPRTKNDVAYLSIQRFLKSEISILDQNVTTQQDLMGSERDESNTSAEVDVSRVILSNSDLARIIAILEKQPYWSTNASRPNFLRQALGSGTKATTLIQKLDLGGAPTPAAREAILKLYDTGQRYFEPFLRFLTSEIVDVQDQKFLINLVSGSGEAPSRSDEASPDITLYLVGRGRTLASIGRVLEQTLSGKQSQVGIVILQGDVKVDQTREFRLRLRWDDTRGIPRYVRIDSSVWSNWDSQFHVELTDCFIHASSDPDGSKRADWCLREAIKAFTPPDFRQAGSAQTEFPRAVAKLPYRTYFLHYTLDGTRAQEGIENYLKSYLSLWKEIGTQNLTNEDNSPVRVVVLVHVNIRRRGGHASSLENQIWRAIEQGIGAARPTDRDVIESPVGLYFTPEIGDVTYSDAENWLELLLGKAQSAQQAGYLSAEGVRQLGSQGEDMLAGLFPNEDSQLPMCDVSKTLLGIYALYQKAWGNFFTSDDSSRQFSQGSIITRRGVLLAVDLSNSTKGILGVGNDPQQAANQLRDLQDRIYVFMRKNGGTIISFTGDGFIGMIEEHYFQEKTAEHAWKITQGLADELHQALELIRGDRMPNISMRCALHWGEVFVSNAGTLHEQAIGRDAVCATRLCDWLSKTLETALPTSMQERTIYAVTGQFYDILNLQAENWSLWRSAVELKGLPDRYRIYIPSGTFTQNR